MRFEDTDPRISFSEYEESLFRTLNWLGFRETFEVFHQNERHDIYKRAALKLVKMEKAYPCFCTGNELAERLENKGCKEKSELNCYDGHCKNLTAKEILEKLKQGMRPAYRLNVEPLKIQIKDIIKGIVEFDTSQVGDFIILRSDGTGLYNFACVIDDILTGVTNVIRGEDHLTNTPKQLLIYKALEVPSPQFAHIPLFLGNQGEKYSKRNLSLSIFQLKNKGYLPEAILNYIFYAGMKNVTKRKILSLEEMAEKFNLLNISSSYCKFDGEQLKYFNKECIKKKKSAVIPDLAVDYLKARGILEKDPDEDTKKILENLVEDLQHRTTNLADLSSLCWWIMSDNPLGNTSRNQETKPEANFKSINGFPALSRESLIESLAQLISIISTETSNSGILKKLSSNKPTFSRLIRYSLTGKFYGIPLKTILEKVPKSYLLKKLSNYHKSLTGAALSGSSLPCVENIRQNRIKYYFKKLFGLNAVKIEKLFGLRNTSYKVECEEGSFVFKKALTGDFINLYHEKEVMKHLGGEGLTPDSPHLNISGEFFADPVLVYGWLEGKPLDVIISDSDREKTGGMFDVDLLKNIAKSLCKIHTRFIPSLPLMLNDSVYSVFSNFRDRFSNYMDFRQSEGLDDDDLILLLKKFVEAMEMQASGYTHCWDHEFPVCLVHGDLRPSNIIRNNRGEISFIDWEEACSDDPAWEISQFLRTNSFDKKQESEFLNIYLEEYEKVFPQDKYFKKRFEAYNLVNNLDFILGSAIHCMELLQGTRKISMPVSYYVRKESEALYSGFADAFNSLLEISNIRKEIESLKPADGSEQIPLPDKIFTPEKLKTMGSLFLVPPELPENTIIVIDGVSSSGKSIVAPEIARRLDFIYINLGAFFRAVVFHLHGKGIDPDNINLAEEIQKTGIDYYHINIPPFFRILINQKDVSDFLYTKEMETIVPLYSGNRSLINFIREKIKSIIKPAKGTVIEGHKAGIEFFPDAPYKFFLILDNKERARLKGDQLEENIEEETIEKMLESRDKKDFINLPKNCREEYAEIKMETLDTGKMIREIFDSMDNG